MGLPPLVPETSASANSATAASCQTQRPGPSRPAFSDWMRTTSSGVQNRDSHGAAFSAPQPVDRLLTRATLIKRSQHYVVAKKKGPRAEHSRAKVLPVVPVVTG